MQVEMQPYFVISFKGALLIFWWNLHNCKSKSYLYDMQTILSSKINKGSYIFRKFSNMYSW